MSLALFSALNEWQRVIFSLCSLLRYRVEHSKRNSISPHYSLFSFLFLFQYVPVIRKNLMRKAYYPCQTKAARIGQKCGSIVLLLWPTQNKLTVILRRCRFLPGRYPTGSQHSQQDMEHSLISVLWYKWNNYLSFIFSESNNRFHANLAIKRSRLTPWASV